MWLLRGDFKVRCCEIPDGSVKLVATDPPYSKDQNLYQYIGEVSNDKLEDRGSLIVYASHYAMLDVSNLILSKAPGLKYLWIIAVKHNGGSCAMHGFHIGVRWKPLVWFVKGNSPDTLEYIEDLVESTPPDKSLHKWAQSTVEAEHVIEHLTIPGQTVLDPPMGSHYGYKHIKTWKEIHRRRIKR
jgi:DNA modification methylase